MAWLINEGPKWILTCVWVLVNIILFVTTYLKFDRSDEYFYLRVLTSRSLCVARASATCLNLNCALILLPICRNLVSMIRQSSGLCKRSIRRQLDNNILYHKWLAYSICLFTALHYYAHCFNFDNLASAYEDVAEDGSVGSLKTVLSLLPNSPNGSWTNPIRSSNSNAIVEVCKSIPGLTGVVITLALVVIVTSSSEVIRRSYFEVFWYTHHLFVIFFIALVLHGIQGVVHYQTNVGDNDPNECADQYESWGPDNAECKIPEFAGRDPQTWKWVIGPIILYVIERIIRFVRSLKKVTITEVVLHPSKVVEIIMATSNFRTEVGQYIFIKIPSISHLEWHPFTMTSSPEETTLSVHLRVAGDWTQKAYDLFVPYAGKDLTNDTTLPKLTIDGPFGTCSEDIFRYNVGVCIGAGIGITPFASVLKSMWYKNQTVSHMKLTKVYLYVISPEMRSFEWFGDLLKKLEVQISEQGKQGLLEYQLYLTRGWDDDKAQRIAAHEGDDVDYVTGLQAKTNYGRPNWDQQFRGIADKHPGTSVGVFFCGPQILSRDLHKKCNQYTGGTGGTKFFYNKENF